MREKYELVKKYYDAGLWTEERVKKAVLKGWLSEEEKKEIIG